MCRLGREVARKDAHEVQRDIQVHRLIEANRSDNLTDRQFHGLQQFMAARQQISIMQYRQTDLLGTERV